MSSLPLSSRARLWFKRTLAMPLNRWYHSDFGRQEFNEGGVRIFEEDWDNLLILDACRYDTFAELQDLPGDLSKRESRASTTPEFVRANIDGVDLTDTVYVTAQPQIHNHSDIEHSFHHIINVWKSAWDPDLRTIPPSPVADAAIKANDRFPDKRLLVHFMQPHYPFIGETGRRHFSYEETSSADGIIYSGEEKFWDTVGTVVNDVSEEIIWEAYRENVEIVLPHVERIMTDIGGKTVVSSDHGEMIYDRAWPVPININGHPGGLYTPELVKVPWHTYISGERRDIVAESPVADKTTDINEEIVKDRLRDLGYT